jgi:hypothetical protein
MAFHLAAGMSTGYPLPYQFRVLNEKSEMFLDFSMSRKLLFQNTERLQMKLWGSEQQLTLS